MTTQSCGKCSAPLELGEPGSVVRCPYCGTDNRMAGAARGEPAAASAKTPTPIKPWIGAAIVLVVTSAAVVATYTGSERGSDPDELVPVEELATTEGVYFKLAPPDGMSGTLAAFPLDTNREWVLRIARAWRPDARFRYMQSEEVQRDGAIASEISYQFTSPAALEDYKRRASTEDPLVEYQLNLRISGGELSATRIIDRPSEVEPPPIEEHCNITDAIAAALAGGALPTRPAYYVSGAFDVQGQPFWQINLLGASQHVTVGPDCQLRE